MKPKIKYNKNAESRSKSAKIFSKSPVDERSYDTIDSASSITAEDNSSNSKAIKKTSNKANYLRQKKGKLKSIKKLRTKKISLKNKKDESEKEDDFCDNNAPLIISHSLFGESKSRAVRRLSEDCDVSSGESKKADLLKNVLVPSWRVVSFRPIYKLEGTENLNDEFYLKRHQKHENEERLIKKRDLRRQKEEFLKFKMLNRNRFTLTNKNGKNKLSVKYNIENELNKSIKERNEENNFEDIEHILILDKIDEEVKKKIDCHKSEVDLPKKLKSKNRNSVHSNNHNLENSRISCKKAPRRKSFACLPLKPVNDNLNNISVNTNSDLKQNLIASVYDDFDSDFNNLENSLAPRTSRPNKRKPNSNSFVNLRCPDKKRTRLSTNML